MQLKVIAFSDFLADLVGILPKRDRLPKQQVYVALDALNTLSHALESACEDDALSTTAETILSSLKDGFERLEAKHQSEVDSFKAIALDSVALMGRSGTDYVSVMTRLEKFRKASMPNLEKATV